MGQSVETRVRVVSFLHPSYAKHPELEHVRHEEYPDETDISPVSKKAAKVLRKAKPGDLVEVVWDYDIEGPGYTYPIVKARLLDLDLLKERVEKMEQWLHNAMGYPIPGQPS
jgi:hypothetical protein